MPLSVEIYFMIKSISDLNKVTEVFSKVFPLVANGSIEIRAVAHGYGRLLVAVSSKNPAISPVGVLSDDTNLLEEIKKDFNNDKIALFLWCDNPKQLIESAFDPVFVDEVLLDESSHSATVTSICGPTEGSEEYQACVALVQELTGWNISLKT